MSSDFVSVVFSRTYWRSVNVIGSEWLQSTKCGLGSRMNCATLGLYASKSGIRQDGVSTTNPVGATSMPPEPSIQSSGSERASRERNGSEAGGDRMNASTAANNSAAARAR